MPAAYGLEDFPYFLAALRGASRGRVLQLRIALHHERSPVHRANGPDRELHQRPGETQSPVALGRRLRYLVLPEFHLDVRQSPAQCMEWDAVVHLWI